MIELELFRAVYSVTVLLQGERGPVNDARERDAVSKVWMGCLLKSLRGMDA